ncbi:hypothetical protein PC116_g8423 [Phytophthora cactorum]|nr:hypothetical protein PC116_g8423 [Phytophthora cactorum]
MPAELTRGAGEAFVTQVYSARLPGRNHLHEEYSRVPPNEFPRPEWRMYLV